MDTLIDGPVDNMAKTDLRLGLYVELQAKPGKANEVADFLRSAQALVEAETGTITWYALRVGDDRFAIFDTFTNESDREVHLNGDVAKALMARAPDLFAGTPAIHKVEVLAAKYPLSAI